MAQYDVYPNPSASSQATVPYVVDVQSRLLGELRTRLVIPLARDSGSPHPRPSRLAPTFQIDGVTVVAQAWLAAPLDARLLKQPVASLAHRGAELRDALDAVCAGL
ncbi:CcdB family protein [Sphaerotilus microaerophilus]|uniref:Toxin CcdB n=1 Tax=Sphaerotilus microaerophilus TaxID=2914710 RepID=A0ABM7YNR3_9BURK|nr:CcdB family protein [Sphaerotilus sp. FB-5]BDI06124.1 hypothetical protein CATMQ487_30940 [Sphaerotilus sp. FB-5]